VIFLSWVGLAKEAYYPGDFMELLQEKYGDFKRDNDPKINYRIKAYGEHLVVTVATQSRYADRNGNVVLQVLGTSPEHVASTLENIIRRTKVTFFDVSRRVQQVVDENAEAFAKDEQNKLMVALTSEN